MMHRIPSVERAPSPPKLLRFSSKESVSILETKNFADIDQYVDDDTLVILDIDNTISETGHGEERSLLGSDQWFYAHMQREITKGLDARTALMNTAKLYNAVHEVATVKPVEPVTPGIIKSWQMHGKDVLALTTRGGGIEQATLRQLSSIEVSFDVGKFKDHDFALSQGAKSLALKGVVFCGGRNKGECLEEYLKVIDYKPKKIVFVDDKYKNIEEVKALCDRLNIPFLGVYYTHLADKLDVDLAIADIQAAKMSSLLTDEEARVLLNHNASKKDHKPKVSPVV
jgi:hypothetical protein